MTLLPYRYLRTARNRILQPHRLAAPLAVWLAGLAELVDAIGRDTGDDRWHAVACELDRAAVALRQLA